MSRVSGSAAGMSGAAVREIVRDYERILLRDGAELTYGGVTVALLLSQAATLVTEVAERFVPGTDRSSEPAAADATLSGLDVVHPMESQRAAVALFEAALPVLARELPGTGADGRIALATLLHRVILERSGHDTRRYLGYLVQRTNNAHLEERRRTARDLHDRISHTVSIALQSIELHDVHEATDRARAQTKLRNARTYLREALADIRQLSADLRDMVDEDGLGSSLDDYLRDNVPADVRVEFHRVEEIAIPPEVGEQVYLVIREAVHNAVLHGRPTWLSVHLSVSDALLSASVRDDGIGFTVGEPRGRRPGLGLTSMRERVELLGGRFVLKSSPRQGTTVEVHIPFIRRHP